jgi:hypothetical protein
MTANAFLVSPSSMEQFHNEFASRQVVQSLRLKQAAVLITDFSSSYQLLLYTPHLPL